MPRANRLFDSLGPATRERLRPHTELVSLEKGRVLCDAGALPRYAYFPLDGLLSLLGVTEDGHTLELGTAGSEGLVGVSLALNASVSPYQVVVQMLGSAHRVRAEAFIRECQRCEDLHAIAVNHVSHVLQQIAQSAVCHAFHSLTQRVCRWLLVSRDGAHSNTIELTQEFVAEMLGVSRPKVSQALVTLEARGVIHQGHGRIHIVDPKGLQQGSCSCYRSMREQLPVQASLRHAR